MDPPVKSTDFCHASMEQISQACKGLDSQQSPVLEGSVDGIISAERLKGLIRDDFKP